MIKSSYYYDDVVRDAFTWGDCWALADEFHKHTRKEYAYVLRRQDDLLSWSHVGIRLTENLVLDVEGVSALDEWGKKWDGYLYITETDIHSNLGLGRYFNVDPQKIARDLLTEFTYLV